MSKSSPSSDLRETAGFVDGVIRQSRLVWRLWRDARVPSWVKVIPLAGLVYLISPIDLIPDLMLPGLGQLDDVAILLLAAKMFIDLSPEGVVREHLEELLGKQGRSSVPDDRTSEPYIDVPYRIVDPDQETGKGEPS
jgi:uncharacterized membrane protein YkvA (DUF1232 family)